MATGDCFSKTRNDMREVNNLLTLRMKPVNGNLISPGFDALE